MMSEGLLRVEEIGRTSIVVALAGMIAALAVSCGERPEMSPAEQPRRIICMAPNITETVFALGAGGRVVGVSSFTTYPPEAANRPQVGALYDANLEKIVALQPDLLIVQQKHERVEKLCAARQIPVLKVNMTRVKTILEGIRVLGRALQAPRRAETLCAAIESDLAAARRDRGDRPPVKVFLCVDRQPGTLKGMFTVGGESFLSEMIALAGGRNVFADVNKDYFAVSLEALVARAPEIVIETRPSQALSADARRRLARDWAALAALPAVRNRRVAILTESYLVVPGPRVARIVERLADCIHGGASHGP